MGSEAIKFENEHKKLSRNLGIVTYSKLEILYKATNQSPLYNFREMEKVFTLNLHF